MRAGVIKEHSDRAYHIKMTFIHIWKQLEEVDEYDETTYVAERKKFQKEIQELFKALTPHIKQGHKEIYEEKLLGEILQPLFNILKSSSRLNLFEF